MSTAVQRRTNGAVQAASTASVIERVVVNGDLAALSPADRMAYYNEVCQSVGLNPYTRPFEYIELSGKLTLYARKDATDQMRSNNGVSIFKLEREHLDTTNGALYAVTAYARDAKGREDSAMGVVSLTKEDGSWEKSRNGRSYFKKNGKLIPLAGDDLANAMMKAERRVTLSICGLGWLDESELGTIPSARSVPVDHETGEIVEVVSQTDEEPLLLGTGQQEEKPAYDFAAARAKIEKRIGEQATPDDYPSVLKQCEAFVEKWPASEKALTMEVIDMGRVILEKRMEAADRGLEHLRMLFEKADTTPSGTFDLEHERLLNHLGKVAKPWPEVWQAWLKERYDALVSQYEFWDQDGAEPETDTTPASVSEPALPMGKQSTQAAAEASEEPTLEDVQESMRAGKLNKYGLQALLRDYEVQHLNKLSASLYASVIVLMRDVSQVAHLNRTGLQYEITQSYKAVKTLKEADTKFSAWQGKANTLYANNDIAAEKVMDHLGKVHEACLKRLGVQAPSHAPQAAFL